MFELSKQFGFDAAHTLDRRIDTESSRRIHGHSYRAEITIRGRPDPATGMLIDLGMLDREIASARDELDHHFLDDIEDLGPATMENLCRWIWLRLAPKISRLTRVSVYRDSGGESCSYWGEENVQ